MHHLDHEQTIEKNERDQKYLEMLAEKIRTTGRKKIISEEDLQAIYETIEQANLPKTRLQNIMLIFGATLRKRTEPDLRTFGGCLILAAKAELPTGISSLEHSLPDLPPQHEEGAIRNEDPDFSNSMIFGEGREEKDEEREDVLPPSIKQSDLAHSGIFTNEMEIEEEAEDKTEEEIYEGTLPTHKDPRLAAIKKLRNGERLTEEDERVRSAKTISIIDIRRTHAPEIGTKALRIKNHQADGLRDLHLEVLTMLGELKNLVNKLLKTVYQNLGNNWMPEKAEKMFHDFFAANQQQLEAIFAIDRAISKLEEDCKEIHEMQMEVDFLQDTVENTSAYYDSLRNTPQGVFMELLRTSILTQIRTLLYHDEEIQERLERVRTDFIEIFQGFWKLEVKITDPWK